MTSKCLVLRLLLLCCVAEIASGQARVEKNVIFGMYSGLALLLDVHRPVQPNGHGVIVVPGSGWNSRQSYDAPPLTDIESSTVRFYAAKLLDAGYTLFVVNHRRAPHFHYPGPVEDMQRAVRFVRYHASAYGINPAKIGALGHSSGAHLSALAGVLDGKEDPEDPDPVNRVSARVQCVVGSATQTDLTSYVSAPATLFMGQVIGNSDPDPVALRAYRAASPVTHVSASSAPMLLIQGDADRVVPFHMAERMRGALAKAGVAVKVIPLPGGTHNYSGETGKHPDWPDMYGEAVRWMDQHLRAFATR